MPYLGINSRNAMPYKGMNHAMPYQGMNHAMLYKGMNHAMPYLGMNQQQCHALPWYEPCHVLPRYEPGHVRLALGNVPKCTLHVAVQLTLNNMILVHTMLYNKFNLSENLNILILKGIFDHRIPI